MRILFNLKNCLYTNCSENVTLGYEVLDFFLFFNSKYVPIIMYLLIRNQIIFKYAEKLMIRELRIQNALLLFLNERVNFDKLSCLVIGMPY